MLDRIEDNFTGGFGTTLFENDTFKVVNWNHGGGDFGSTRSTTLEPKVSPPLRIRFDGVVDTLITNELCIRQFTGEELMQILNHTHINAFGKGEKAKAIQFRRCLDI